MKLSLSLTSIFLVLPPTGFHLNYQAFAKAVSDVLYNWHMFHFLLIDFLINQSDVGYISPNYHLANQKNHLPILCFL